MSVFIENTVALLVLLVVIPFCWVAIWKWAKRR